MVSIMHPEMNLFAASTCSSSSLFDVVNETNAMQNRIPPSSPSGSESGRKDSVSSDKISTRYKTELCRAFCETGICKYADKCQFAHGRCEIREVPRHPKYKTELCRCYHSTGFCTYGKRCHFVHEAEEARRPIAEVVQKASFPLPPSMAKYLPKECKRPDMEWYEPSSPSQSSSSSSPRSASPMYQHAQFGSPVPASPKTPRTPFSAMSSTNDDVFTFATVPGKNVFSSGTGKSSPDSTASFDSGLNNAWNSPMLTNGSSVFQFPEVVSTKPQDTWTTNLKPNENTVTKAFTSLSTWSNTESNASSPNWVLASFFDSSKEKKIEEPGPWMDLLKDF